MRRRSRAAVATGGLIAASFVAYRTRLGRRPNLVARVSRFRAHGSAPYQQRKLATTSKRCKTDALQARNDASSSFAMVCKKPIAATLPCNRKTVQTNLLDADFVDTSVASTTGGFRATRAESLTASQRSCVMAGGSRNQVIGSQPVTFLDGGFGLWVLPASAGFTSQPVLAQ